MHLKKTIFLLSMLLTGQCLFAGVVPQERARQIAADFFSSQKAAIRTSSVKAETFNLVYSYKVPATKASDQSPALYVFGRPSGGYAIVSGDDAARPVLAWSPDGYFPTEGMPDNMKAMIEWYGQVIDFARSQGWKSASAPTAAAGEKVLLETAQWDQHHPFNDLLYEVNGEKPPIGCVATAIGIIMRYHMWPEKGAGTLPAYRFWDYYLGGYRDIAAVTLGHRYEWDKMPDEARNGQYTSEESAAISRLMYDIAVMCNMEFSPGGSSSITWNAAKLMDYFDYDKSMGYISRKSYPVNDLQWEQAIKDEIDAGRPVLYSGQDESGMGHAYVIDGYYDRYFSINWGWGGSGISNGVPTDYREGTKGWRWYYTLTPIEGHENELEPYYVGQSAMIRIMKNQGGEPSASFFTSDSDVTALDPDFKINKGFYVYTHIQNSYAGAVTRDFRYDLTDRYGNLKETVSREYTITIPNDYSSDNFYCRVSVPLADGDRRDLMVKDPVTGNWEKVFSNRRNRFVFTSRSLSELVEVGYVEQANPSTGNPKDFYVHFYKDICWDIVDNSTGQPFLAAPYYHGYQTVSGLGQERELLYVDLLNRDDPDCDIQVVRLALPDGSYTLKFFNPVTEEERVIYLEI